MKKLLSLLVIAVVVTGGIVLWQNALFARLSAQLEEQTDEIAQGYAKLVHDDVQPIAARHDLTLAQQRLVDRMHDSIDALADTSLAMTDTLQHISMLQSALVSFAASEDEQLRNDPQFQHVAEEISDRSSLRDLLRSYNDTAAKWNARLQSNLGSLTESFGTAGRAVLPYLRFDGEQDFVPVISL